MSYQSVEGDGSVENVAEVQRIVGVGQVAAQSFRNVVGNNL